MKLKKIFAAAALSVAALQANADEGMWTLSNLPQQVYNIMQQEGYSLPYSQLYEADDAIVKSVVNFGGYCSGVVVSPDGLVFTNHHCGFDAIRSHSTVEHDYMLNGFTSASFEEELPNEGLFVAFMVEQRDVTDEVLAAGLRDRDASEQEALLDSLEQEYSQQVQAKDNTLRAELKPFYEGNRYYLTTYRDFRDVRLVFAIPKSIGKFGGETDNWMWPRQTCDFSVFRVYCSPDGKPADYSPENVPYHPQTWAHISWDGYKEGDFAMTMGYPGSTERYLSSFGIKQMRDCENAPRYQVRTVRQDAMLRHMRADEAVRIKYDSKYAHSANYWKNALGMNKCIDSINIIGLKQQHEANVRQYQERTGYLKDDLNIDVLGQLYTSIEKPMMALNYFYETFGRTNEVVSRSMRFFMAPPVEGPADNEKKQYVLFKDNSEEWDLQTEKDILIDLLENYLVEMSRLDMLEYIPDFYADIHKAGGYQKYVDALYNSPLMSNKPLKIGKKSVQKKLSKDYAVKMGMSLVSTMSELSQAIAVPSEMISNQERLLCDAKVRMEEDMPHYSDANFTLRLSYGQVGGYMINGHKSGYYTTPESLYRKMLLGDKATASDKYNFEYYAEPVMHKLFSAKDFGQYNDPITGTMNLCFLTNNDITGGNSGSPVFNGKNELIGLAFDGNWDSLSGDIFFDRTLARCICVDIRYVLFMMDKWGGAKRLIEEMKK